MAAQFRTKKDVVEASITEAATGVDEEMADVGLAMRQALDKT